MTNRRQLLLGSTASVVAAAVGVKPIYVKPAITELTAEICQECFELVKQWQGDMITLKEMCGEPDTGED